MTNPMLYVDFNEMLELMHRARLANCCGRTATGKAACWR
jgi:hypothetical protein